MLTASSHCRLLFLDPTEGRRASSGGGLEPKKEASPVVTSVLAHSRFPQRQYYNRLRKGKENALAADLERCCQEARRQRTRRPESRPATPAFLPNGNQRERHADGRRQPGPRCAAFLTEQHAALRGSTRRLVARDDRRGLNNGFIQNPRSCQCVLTSGEPVIDKRDVRRV